MLKPTIRKEITKKLKNLKKETLSFNSNIIYKRLLSIKDFKNSKKIGIYFAKENEVSTIKIINYLIKKNKSVFLPKINNNFLEFKKIKKISDLKIGPFDIFEPIASCKTISIYDLDLLIMPCVAIDNNGNRLGRGKGYYDRFLKQHKNLKTICLSHDFQKIKSIPTEKHDKKIDIIITEKETIKTDQYFYKNKILDGNKVANEITTKIKEKIKQKNLELKLAVILVGNNPASKIYVEIKQKKCHEIGINFELKKFDENITAQEIKNKIKEYNSDKQTTGILVQLPLPKHLNTQEVIDTILPIKDVDGLTTENQKKLKVTSQCLECCTPKGILTLLEKNKISLKNKKVVLVGYGKLVGKPLSLMLENKKINYSVCNSKTINLKNETRKANILICATGKPKLITKNHIKKGTIIIDAGTSKVDNKIIGDTDLNNLINKVAKITPSIGGIGPLTIATLIENLKKAHDLQKISSKT